MQEADLPRLTATVLWSAFALSVLFGAIANRTRFCTMGAVADIVHMGDWARMRMWVLGMAVAIIGFNGMVAMGWVQAASSIYAGRQLLWMSAMVGGAMFGFGMVLGSGCGSRSLVRLGAGNLKSLVVLVVMGVAAFATLKGLTAVWRVRTVDAVVINLPTGQDLPSMLAGTLHWPVPQTALVLGVFIASLMLAWVLRDAAGRSADVLLGGVGVGAIIVALWWVSGRLGYLAEHPETLQEAFLATNSRRMESMSLASPVAYTLDWLLFYSDATKVLTLGIVSVLGLPVGSAIVAKATGTFRWEGFANVRDLGNHLVGASLMGVGGVTALGCTVGQGLSGISTLSLGSLLAVAAIVVGAIAGVRYQAWQIEREV